MLLLQVTFIFNFNHAVLDHAHPPNPPRDARSFIRESLLLNQHKPSLDLGLLDLLQFTLKPQPHRPLLLALPRSRHFRLIERRRVRVLRQNMLALWQIRQAGVTTGYRHQMTDARSIRGWDLACAWGGVRVCVLDLVSSLLAFPDYVGHAAEYSFAFLRAAFVAVEYHVAYCEG